MQKILLYLLDSVLSGLRRRSTLQIEVIVLRHQLDVLQRTRPARVRFTRLDRILWLLLYRLWPRCLDAMVIVKPETVRFRWSRFGPMFAAEIRKRRVQQHRCHPRWRWHLDEVFVKINGKTHYLWRAVDHEGKVLEVFASKRRGRKAALKFLKRTMNLHGRPKAIVTDRLRSDRAAMRDIGNEAHQETGRWLNNRAENSHQRFRRREKAMARFRNPATLQKFASIHASLHNHFNQERHLYRRDIFKQNRSTALSEWRKLCAA